MSLTNLHPHLLWHWVDLCTWDITPTSVWWSNWFLSLQRAVSYCSWLRGRKPKAWRGPYQSRKVVTGQEDTGKSMERLNSLSPLQEKTISHHGINRLKRNDRSKCFRKRNEIETGNPSSKHGLGKRHFPHPNQIIISCNWFILSERKINKAHPYFLPKLPQTYVKGENTLCPLKGKERRRKQSPHPTEAVNGPQPYLHPQMAFQGMLMNKCINSYCNSSHWWWQCTDLTL